MAEVLYPGTARRALPPHLDGPPPAREKAVLALVRGHSEVVGPFGVTALAQKLGIEDWECEVAAAELEQQGAVLRGRFTPGSAVDEFCDRRLLARIHRQTLDRLRREIEPVGAQDFLRFLFERHGLLARTRLGGKAGLRDVIGRLQGFEVAAAAWERDVLPARVGGYRSEWLDELCLSGEVCWARLSPKRSISAAMGSTSRATPITLANRRDMRALVAAVRGGDESEVGPAPIGETATRVLDALQRRGALFLDDLASAARMGAGELTEALWDLVARGMVTSDGFEPLRDLMRRTGATWRGQRGAQGRWSVVEEPWVDDGQREGEELPDRVAEQLLARYGVVFRELVARESFAVPWRDIARTLRRREARGLVRGGRFVAGFVGEQFALPEAVEGLRRVRRAARTGECVKISAADPLNLVGILTPGPRVSPSSTEPLLFRDGAYEPPEELTAVSG
jgi:ATP-dependent Lhr-like helicase